MNIHIDEDIQEMLYENGSVVVPGVGAFRGSYKSANIDGIQGHLAPPSLDISFDPNTIINDGVFLDFLKKKYRIPAQEAQTALDVFRDNAYHTFEKHELIVIPQVGRLYRDFNSKLQFLPDITNFNTDTFGLPTAQFHPVSRTPVEKTAAVEALINNVPPPPAFTKPFPESTTDVPFPTISGAPIRSEMPVQWRKFIPGLTIAVLFIMIFTIYMHNQNEEKLGTKAEKSKINVSPVKPVDNRPSENNPVITPTPPPTKQADKAIAHDKMLDSAPKTDMSRDNRETKSSAITPPTSATKKSEARIILGGFGDKNNINRHKKWLTANGFGINERPSGSIIILSADVAYNDKQELNRIMSRLIGRFGAEAVKIQRTKNK